MASVRPDESELNRVFNALRLVFAAQAGKSDPVVDALRVVVMSDVQHDTLFSTVKQKPASGPMSFVLQYDRMPYATYRAVTSRTRNSAQRRLRHAGVVYTFVIAETRCEFRVTAQIVVMTPLAS